jgi:hypothetical protein
MIKGWTKFAGVLVFAAALLGVASSAKADMTTPFPTTWKVQVTGSAATKAAGRADFVEYIYVDANGFSGEQLCRLGMQQTVLNVTAGVPTGTYNVSCTMVSNTYGTMVVSGTVNNTQMQGTMTWTIGTTAYTYTYSGVPYTPDPNVVP